MAEPFFLTRLRDFERFVRSIVGWGRKWSFWPLPFGTACCAIEYMAVVASHFDVSRWGAEVVRFSPRQADLLIVAGTITRKIAEALKRVYEQMAEPKWVISFGSCASSGNGIYQTYSVLDGIDKIIPVDVYVAGCPPRPEALLEAIEFLQKKVEGKIEKVERPYIVGGHEIQIKK